MSPKSSNYHPLVCELTGGVPESTAYKSYQAIYVRLYLLLFPGIPQLVFNICNIVALTKLRTFVGI
jgi:hypothetical protein